MLFVRTRGPSGCPLRDNFSGAGCEFGERIGRDVTYAGAAKVGAGLPQQLSVEQSVEQVGVIARHAGGIGSPVAAHQPQHDEVSSAERLRN